MKKFILLDLSCLLLCGNGCMTGQTLQKARDTGTGQPEAARGSAVAEANNSKPGYYCLVPLSVAADAATSPVQIATYVYLRAAFGDWWKD